MEKIYIEFFEPILTNTIVVTWVAPLIVAGIIDWIKNFFSNRKMKTRIKKSNERILRILIPFFIKNISITRNTVLSVKNTVAIEDELKTNEVYSLMEIKDALILEIASTRLLKDEEKEKVFQKIEEIFIESNIKENNIEYKIENYNRTTVIDNTKDFREFYLFSIGLLSILAILSEGFNIRTDVITMMQVACLIIVIVSPAIWGIIKISSILLKVLDYFCDIFIDKLNKIKNQP